MSWHTKRNNLVILAESLKFSRSMALMTIKYKKAIGSNCAVLCMFLEVLKPGKPKLICCPAVLADGDCPIAWEVVIFVPSREVVLPREDNKWWDNPAL